MRICSLLPSATEIVYALGLGDQLVAVTHECDFPPEATRLPAITRSAIDHAVGTSREIHNHILSAVHHGSSIYHLNQALLKTLDPDLILTQELCEVCAVSYDEVRRAVRVLEGERRVVSLEPSSLNGMLDTIATVGEITRTVQRADEIIRGLRERIRRIESLAVRADPRPSVLALEWLDPPFIGGHWVPEMVRLAGGTDGVGGEGRYSETVTWERIAAYDPDVIILMPCGFDLSRTVTEASRTTFPEAWRQLKAVRMGAVYAVNGSAYFARPGPRLVDGLEIMAEVLHPDLFPRTKSLQDWRPLEMKGLKT